MNQALEPAFKTWTSAVKRLPQKYRDGIEAEFKTVMEAIYRAGYAAAMDAAGKAVAGQPPVTVRFEPGAFAITNTIPADVNVKQDQRNVVVERDDQGRVIGARQA